MSTDKLQALDYDWILPEAREQFEAFAAQRQAIIDRYAHAETATAIAALQRGDAERQCRAEIAPIAELMVHLVAKYTRPKPLIVAKDAVADELLDRAMARVVRDTEPRKT